MKKPFVKRIEFRSIVGCKDRICELTKASNSTFITTHLPQNVDEHKTSSFYVDRFDTQLPSNRRGNAILMYEYRISASAPWLFFLDEKSQSIFFQKCHDWVQNQYLSPPLLSVVAQADSSKPSSLSVLILPIGPDGSLNATWYKHQKLDRAGVGMTFTDSIASFVSKVAQEESQNRRHEKKQQKRLTQQLNRQELKINKLNSDDRIRRRKADTHHKIQLGGLVIKSGLAGLTKAQMLGAMIEAMECANEKERLLRWEQRGSESFGDSKSS